MESIAISIDLFGQDVAGNVVWHFVPRSWDAMLVMDLYEGCFEPRDPWPSWAGELTVEAVIDLLKRFNYADERKRYPGDGDLEALLAASTATVHAIIEEWGYG